MVVAKEGRTRPATLTVALCVALVVGFLWTFSSSTSGCTQQYVHHSQAHTQLQTGAGHGAWQEPSSSGREWGPRATPASRRGGKYVITSVMGLDPERLNIFVASLRRHSPATKLVVFVEEQTDPSLLLAAGAQVINFTQPEDSALVLHRFELYKQYLTDLLANDTEAGVMLTDSRDVLIQKDPWQHPLVQQLIDEDAMLFSLEGGLAVGDVPLKAQPQNAHWMDTCYGEEVTEKLADTPISCAGITIGSVSAVHAYVTQLLDTAYNVASSKCRKYGSDQATHNYMLHELGPAGKLAFPYHVRRNWDSPVHTAGYGWPITISRSGQYKRVNGELPAIVHQYDRAYEATKTYLAMYPIKPPMPAEDYRWEGPECVKNLYLDTVVQCPEEDGDKSKDKKEEKKAAEGKDGRGGGKDGKKDKGKSGARR